MRSLARTSTRFLGVLGFKVLGLALVTALVLPRAAHPQHPASQEEDAANAVDFTTAEKAWLAAHPVIRVGAETNYAPYEFQDSRKRFSGVVADYMEILKRQLGVRFDVRQMPDFATVESKLQKGEVDVVLALVPTSEREEHLLFTKPYLHYVNVIVTRDDFGFVTGLRDLAPERVGVVKGHSSQQLAARAYPNYSVTAYSDLLEGLMAVSTGKADGLLDDIFPIVFNIRYHQISNLKIATPVEKVLQPRGFSIAVRKDWPELVGILDKVLANISHEEEREISQKWLSVRYESKVDYRAIWTSVAIFSAILLAAILWITQLNKQRKALLAARTEAEAANRAKDQFLASMSHELRTPLHAILGYADLIRKDALTEPARKDALDTIAGSGRHLLTLINDLLDLSRIRSGHLELNPAPVQLPALLEEIAAMVRVEAQQKGLAFVLEAPADLPVGVQADGKRIRQILLNLLGNAIKFTDTGRVTLSVQAVPVDSGSIRLRVSVEDTGMGIAPEDQTRIFTPFEQTEQGRKREAGVGLGLAISQELAHLMGGVIEVQSRLGEGSQFLFTVMLPLVDEQLVEATTHQRIVAYEGARRRILVADDQEENRQLMQRMLEPLGFDVALAGDGHEATVAALERHPDLIVMDLRMPEMDGFEAAHTIRREPGLRRVPLVAASASTSDLERAEADPDTFSTCLRKPFQAADLIDTIGRILDLKWRYVETDGPPPATVRKPATQLVPPPRAVLQELLDLARLGKLVRVEQRALELEQEEALRPFAHRLFAMARRLDEEGLVAMLEACLRAHRDAVTE
jgi:signal transduction histidine kinase/FixJ family two-component response regulator